MPASPAGLNFREASQAYLQTLTAYFFPTVTTQIANVLCKRSWKISIFSVAFLDEIRRREALERIAHWRVPRYTTRVKIDYRLEAVTEIEALKAFIVLAGNLVLYPFKFAWMLLTKSLVKLERPVIEPFTSWLARFLERHYIIFNFISNPLIDLGIMFELTLCYVFFYTPVSQVYFFAPVPWHVYLFAFHGTALLFIFEETKKYYRRKGYSLDFLG